MEKLFPRIETIGDVLRLARGGGIAGLVFAAIILLSGLLPALLGTSHPYKGPSLAPVAATILEAGLIVTLSLRIWTGRAYVSACLLFGLFVARAATEMTGGLYGLCWAVIYFWAGVMLLNAVRASLRHEAYALTPADLPGN